MPSRFLVVLLLNKRPNEELKRVSGANDVSTLAVGRSVHRGYEPTAYQALLDSALAKDRLAAAAAGGLPGRPVINAAAGRGAASTAIPPPAGALF